MEAAQPEVDRIDVVAEVSQPASENTIQVIERVDGYYLRDGAPTI